VQLAFDEEAKALQLGLDQLDLGDGEHEDSEISKLVCDGVQALGRLLLRCKKLIGGVAVEQAAAEAASTPMVCTLSCMYVAHVALCSCSQLNWACGSCKARTRC